MKKYFLVYCLIAIHFVFNYNYLSAQTTNISGQINSFARVTAITTNTITIDNVSLATSPAGATVISEFGNNKKIMIVQMKGASISTANDVNFGNLTALDNAGNYELITIQNIVGSSAPYTITFKSNFLRGYTVAGNVQIVSVPEYTNANVNGDITTINWDATLGRGGVISFEVKNTLTIGASIDASGRGFAGGLINVNNGGGNLNSLSYRVAATDNSCGTQYQAGKGEGIADYAFNSIPGMSFGRGKIVNGGGGGNEHNGGGGGGSNFSMGGDGGAGWNGAGTCSGGTATGAGLKGIALSYTTSVNKIFLGGGAGAGQQNNNVATPGTAGGGIILVRAGILTVNTGSPATRGFYANGTNNVQTGGNDGGGGGGGGGTVILDVLTYNLTATLNVSANGGNGSNVNDGTTHGGGGGGGIGPILLKNPVPAAQVANANFVSTAGVGGLNCSSCPRTENGGASPTGSSVITGWNVPGDITALPISLGSFKAYWDANEVKIDWTTISEINVNYFEIERADASMRNIKVVAQKQATGFSATPINYTAKDELPLSSLAYYRLKSVDNDGSIQYSNWVAVKNSQKLQVKIYPNPAQDYVVIEGDESLDKAKVVLLSIEGQIIKETDFSKAVTLQLNELPKGLYILKIIGKMQISHHKIIVE